MADEALQQSPDRTIACPTCGLAVSVTQTACPVDGTPLTSLSPGFVLDGKYEFIELVGSGGMGVIYKARQIILNKVVAVKMLHSHMISDKAMMRFQREGKAGSALSHQNITVVHDFSISEHGQPYMILDFEVGKTLMDMVDEQGALNQTMVVDAMIQVCQGLSHAHDRNVLHRDLKPSNLMLVQNGLEPPLIKILDFGIAKILDSSESKSKQLTRTGETMGSPPYMSPEQSVSANVDRRSDLYSLGCVMFECLTGTPPFMAENVFNIMMAHANTEPPTLREASLGTIFPKELERIVKKLLEKKPENRYQTAQQLEAHLRRLKSGGSAPDSGGAQAKSGGPKFTVILSVAVGMVALAAVGCVYFIPKITQPQSVLHGIAGSADTKSVDSQGRTTDKTSAAFDKYVGSTGADKPDGSAATNKPGSSASLTLSSMPEIPDSDPSFLDDYLQHAKRAEYLQLGNHDLADKDLIKLENSTNCQRLDLQNNDIKGPGLAHLSGLKKLSILRLDHNDLHDNSLQPLLKLHGLVMLHLGFNPHFTGADFSASGKANRVTDLNLEGTGVTDDSLKALTKLGCILSLNLAHTDVSSKGMKSVAAIKELRSVILAGTKVDKSGLATLCSGNPTILTLFVNGLNIGDESVQDILKLKDLDAIDISGTNITSKGIMQLITLKKLNKIWCASCDSSAAIGWINTHRPDIKIAVMPRVPDPIANEVPKNLGTELDK